MTERAPAIVEATPNRSGPRRTPAPHGASLDSSAIRRVLLATDLSRASENATRAAIDLAREARATLIVLSVVDAGRLHLPGNRFVRRVDQERAEVMAGVQRVVGKARTVGVSATFLVWEGDPAETIIAAAASESADVIVIGSHGRGRIGRILLGSTSRRVSEDAPCPVEVIAS